MAITAQGQRPKVGLDKHSLKPQSFVSQMFFERIRHAGDDNESAEDSSILTLTNVDSLLNSLTQTSCPLLNPEALPADLSCSPSNPSSPLFPFTDPPQKIIVNLMFSSQSDVARAYSETRSLTPFQLLYTLMSCLVSESLLLNFNYVTVHRRCMLVLRALEIEFAPEVEKWERENPGKEGALPLEEKIRLHNVIAIMLRMTATAYSGTLKPYVDLAVGEVTARRLAEIMMPFIESEGDAEIENVRDTLS
ncbi:hypothetical protein BDZ45DRAFT_740225 [Acephala macrosclerotiorum]|nr:hypothetical protein BDZ45DRAFT_740225 [Acephala macrosclerotiorum]